MDGQRFDNLARSLAAGASRRAFLRGMAASAAAGALSLIGGRRAVADHNARCRDFNDNCRSNAECCRGVCVDFHCACPPGLVFCAGNERCVPTCTGGRVVNQETCQCECPPNTGTCGTGATATCCATTGFKCCNDSCRPCLTGGACPGASCNPVTGSPSQCCSGVCLVTGFRQGVCA